MSHRMKERLAYHLNEQRQRLDYLKKHYGQFKISEVTLEQIISGIRGVTLLITDTSYVDPHQGIRIRDFTIPELLRVLPKARNSAFPLAGGLYYLLMTGEVPDETEAWEVEETWKERMAVPEHVFRVIDAMPRQTHPMTLLSQAILALQTESIFARRYEEGISKPAFWGYYLEDSLNLTAKLPVLAAYIYNRKYRQGEHIPPHPDLDWSANFAYMIGRSDDPIFVELMRLYFVLHSDHEGGNVTAYSANVVSSSLADIYFTASAGINGLAGPLHGLANQECTRWLLRVLHHFGGLPSEEQLETYVREQVERGMTIPGYGHAVLRTVDPRFTALADLAETYFPQDTLYRLVKRVYAVVPRVLASLGKVKNPWPNVDAISGALLYHFGVRQLDFYTVLFGISRMLGVTAQTVWSRGLYKPLERPKSITSQMLEAMIAQADETAPAPLASTPVA